MRNLLRNAIICLVILGGVSGVALAQTACNYGYDYIFGYSPWDGDSYQQGTDMFVEYEIYYPYGYASVSIDISTDGGNSWTEVKTGAPYDGWYYNYTYVTIPWTLQPSSKCVVRMREVPYYYGDCAYNYDGYNAYDQYWNYYPAGYYFTIAPGCYQPAITSQPPDQVGCAGFPTTFTVGADIGPGKPSMSYEWYKGTTLFATTASPSYTFPSVSVSDAGSYKCRVKNLCGKQVDSRVIVFTVNSPAVITTQPVGATICPGFNGSLTIGATGTNVTYQWRKGGVNIAGATSNTYNITAASVADDGVYTCVVTAACGLPVTSAAATIVVPSPPNVIQQPVGGGYCPGTDAVVTAVVTGNGLSYQWYKDEYLVPGATASNLTLTNIQPKDVGSYWLKIRGGAGACVTTANTQATNVYVYGPPRILQQPKSVDLCVRAQTQLIVSAEGTDLQYQWYRNGSPIPNSNNYSLVLNGTNALSGTYSVDVRSACNGFVKSEDAVVAVVQTPVITSQPMPQNLNVGQMLTLSIGANDARTITWLRNEQVVSTGTSSTFTIPAVAVSDGGYYRAILENTCGSATSHTALVLVTDPTTLVPLMEITSENLNLGDVPIGYEKDRTFDNLIINLGAAPLDVSSMSVSGGDAAAFSILSGGAPFSLAPGEMRTVQINFHPAHLGAATGALDISSNAAPGSHSVPVRGNGVLLYSMEPMLSFGNVMLTQSKDDCLEVTNNSATDIVIDQINLGGQNAGDFMLTSTTPMAIGAGQSKDVCLTFTPSAEGARVVTLAFLSSTGGNSNAGANGNGTPVVGVTEDARNAGMTIYPNPTTGSVTISTGGTIATSISIITVTGQVVATIVPTNTSVQWDCTSSHGTHVSSGTYNVVVNTTAGSYTMTLSIVR